MINHFAQASVRYSNDHPDVYIESNLIGFYNILGACRHSYNDGAKGVKHLMYASSSSVYGGNKKVPFSTDYKVDNPVPPYVVYNIGGGQPENLLDYISTLQEELVRAGVLPADYDFEDQR